LPRTSTGWPSWRAAADPQPTPCPHTLPALGEVTAPPANTGEAAIEQLDASITNQQSPEGSPAEAGVPAQEAGMGPATGQPGAAGGEGVEQAPEAAIMNAYATALELISAAARTDRALDERNRPDPAG
jgi:hypothetical protein